MQSSAGVVATTDVHVSANVFFSSRIPLKNGWNLISLSWVPDDDSVAGIFAGIQISQTVWTWEKSRFVTVDHLDPLRGYWVFLDGNDTTVDLTKSADGLASLTLDRGWNLISIRLQTVTDPLNTIFSSVNVSPAIWAWANNRLTLSPDQLNPLSGYWVHLDGDPVSVPIP